MTDKRAGNGSVIGIGEQANTPAPPSFSDVPEPVRVSSFAEMLLSAPLEEGDLPPRDQGPSRPF